MVAVISGGRPKLSERPIHRMLPMIADMGLADIVWVTTEKDAESYESDGFPFLEIPTDWRFEYSRTHWLGHEQPTDPNGFLGAFAGREWANITAEQRGYWGCLQLDDNLLKFQFSSGSAGDRIMENHHQLALATDLLASVALSTNAQIVGASVTSIPEPPTKIAFESVAASCFIEKTGPKREHWHGPISDDVLQSFQYATRPDGTTAAVMPLLRYAKEQKSKTGMRAHYNNQRYVDLQKMLPHWAKITVKPEGKLSKNLIPGRRNNPLRITNPDLFNQCRTRMNELLTEWHTLNTRPPNRTEPR